MKYKEEKEWRRIKKNCAAAFTNNLILRQFLDNSLKYKEEKGQIILFIAQGILRQFFEVQTTKIKKN